MCPAFALCDIDLQRAISKESSRCEVEDGARRCFNCFTESDISLEGRFAWQRIIKSY